MSEPPGDFFAFARKAIPGWQPRLMFDVGANVGQTCLELAARFPDSRIHAFEPSPDSCAVLAREAQRFPNITTHNIALGSRTARLPLTQQGTTATTNRLLTEPARPGEATVMVEVRTGADIFEALKAERIDFLKIDAEGHDYDVLLGFLPVLGQVDFIKVEAAMNPYNKTHVPLRLFEDLLWHRGFHLFRIFEQSMEWKRGGRPVLRRCNPVFINGRLLDLAGIN